MSSGAYGAPSASGRVVDNGRRDSALANGNELSALSCSLLHLAHLAVGYVLFRASPSLAEAAVL